MGAVGPFIFGVFHSLTGGGTAGFWFLNGAALVALGAGAIAIRLKFLEDA
jgi:cyanate permease